MDNSATETMEGCPSLRVKASLPSMFGPIISYLLNLRFQFGIRSLTYRCFVKCVVVVLLYAPSSIFYRVAKPEVLKYSPEKKNVLLWFLNSGLPITKKNPKKMWVGLSQPCFFPTAF